MGSSQVSQANNKAKSQAAASRLSYLRNEKFVTQGFKSNEPLPSLSEARKMHMENMRLYASQTPMPRITT